MVLENDTASYSYFSLHIIQETKNYLINDKLIDCYSVIEILWPGSNSFLNVSQGAPSILYFCDGVCGIL